jgi:hypothetical protein
MNRQGAAINFTVLLVLAVLVIVIFSPFIVKTLFQAQAEIPRDVCKASVLAAAAAKGIAKVTKLDFESSLHCYTQDVEIREDDEEGMKRQLAKELTGCWDQFLQGEKELFNDDAVFCHICSVVSFEKQGGQLAGFRQHLQETPMPRTEGTYFDFLTGYQTRGAKDVGVHERVSTSPDVLDRSKKYAPVFIYARGRDKIQAFATNPWVVGIASVIAWGLTGGPQGIGIVLGIAMLIGDPETEWIAVTQFIEYNPEQLKALGCERKVPVEKRG